MDAPAAALVVDAPEAAQLICLIINKNINSVFYSLFQGRTSAIELNSRLSGPKSAVEYFVVIFESQIYGNRRY